MYISVHKVNVDLPFYRDETEKRQTEKLTVVMAQK